MLYRKEQDIIFLKDDEKYNTHFNWLFRAILLVQEKYLTYTVHSKDNTEQLFHKERVFAYELYRQWANILENECNEPLVLNAELDKIIEEEIKVNDVNEKKTIEIRKYPDLVLHQGQGTSSDQKIICEIKKNCNSNISSPAIFGDLYKLACYMDKKKFHTGKAPFDYGVFILLNGTSEQIKQIRGSNIIVSSNIDYNYSQFEKEMKRHFKRIICVLYDGNILHYDTLSSIMNLR